MAGLTLQQLQEKGATPVQKTGGLTLSQIQQSRPQPTSFEPKKSTSIFGKVRDFATSVIGGGKLAEGAGLALAAPGIQKEQERQSQDISDRELRLTKLIAEQKKAGKDTSRLEKALAQTKASQKEVSGQVSSFTEALPSNKEVIGSSLRLGATLSGGALASGLSRGGVGFQAAKTLVPRAGAIGQGLGGLFGVGQATTFGSGFVRGAGAGASVGAIEGGIHGAGLGLEENKDAGGVAGSALMGAGIGAATGGVLGGVFGGVGGTLRGKEQRLLDAVTPTTKELTPTEFQEALRRGQITPATAGKPAQFTLNEAQKDTAIKFKGLIDSNPVKTSINIGDKIGELDDEVSQFLKTNNSIFSKGELRNSLTSVMDDIDDITIPEARLIKAKTQLVDSFMERLEKGDMHTLWEQRKLFDSQIDKAFSGSPTTQKQIKIALRNAVQEFIADGTPDELYKGFMGDMSNLFRLQETVGVKASQQRDLSLIRKWIKNNPLKSKIIGGATVLGAGSSLIPLFRGE